MGIAGSWNVAADQGTESTNGKKEKMNDCSADHCVEVVEVLTVQIQTRDRVL